MWIHYGWTCISSNTAQCLQRSLTENSKSFKHKRGKCRWAQFISEHMKKCRFNSLPEWITQHQAILSPFWDEANPVDQTHCLRPINSWYALPQIGKLSTHCFRSTEQSEGLVIVDENGLVTNKYDKLTFGHLLRRAVPEFLFLLLLVLANFASLRRSFFSSLFLNNFCSCSSVFFELSCFNLSASLAREFLRCCCIASNGFSLNACRYVQVICERYNNLLASPTHQIATVLKCT